MLCDGGSVVVLPHIGTNRIRLTLHLTHMAFAMRYYSIEYPSESDTHLNYVDLAVLTTIVNRRYAKEHGPIFVFCSSNHFNNTYNNPYFFRSLSSTMVLNQHWPHFIYFQLIRIFSNSIKTLLLKRHFVRVYCMSASLREQSFHS